MTNKKNVHADKNADTHTCIWSQ